MNRTEYRTRKSDVKSWEEVFDHPQDIEVVTVETGKTVVPLWGMLNLNHPNAVGMKNREVEVPVFAHVLRHKALGNYLIDCGLDTSFQRRP
jgi:hypothetical protein